MALVTNLLLFLLTGGTLCLIIWTSFELFRSQEDPLSDRLEGLQSQAMVVAARATRRKASARGLDRFLYLIALVPGGAQRIKVLGRGEVGKALTVHAHKFSGTAAQKIAAAGGATEQLP